MSVFVLGFLFAGLVAAFCWFDHNQDWAAVKGLGRLLHIVK
jgi:hypothetical protein